jgi:hypothetical protein
MTVAHPYVGLPTVDRRHDAEARRQFWIAFTLAVGIAASLAGLVAAGVALAA